MELDKKVFKKLVLLSLISTLIGCGQDHEFLDQAYADKNNIPQDYIDFSDLPINQPAEEQPIKNDGQDSTQPPKADSGAGNQPIPAGPQTPPATKTPEIKPPVTSNPGPQTPPKDKSPAPQPGAPQPTPNPTIKKTNIGVGTVYYLPVYGEKRNCAKEEVTAMRDENEKVLVPICKDELWNCAMQGSCFYLDKEGVTLYAYKKMVEIVVPGTKKTIRQPRFRPNKEFTLCPQGMGAHRICLDPYRSIAADPKFHKIGDVVYVPLLRGQKLPDGETHDGYLVVRDTGGNIKGEGRFDFFIGFDTYKGHLFTKLGLATKRTNQFVYHLVPEELAAKVRAARRYPMAPPKVHTNAYQEMRDVLGLNTVYAITKQTIEFYKMKLL